MKHIYLLIFLIPISLFAQDDLFSEIDTEMNCNNINK